MHPILKILLTLLYEQLVISHYFFSFLAHYDSDWQGKGIESFLNVTNNRHPLQDIYVQEKSDEK